MVLYFKFLLFSDDNLNVVLNYINILNIITLLLCLIISVDNYYLFYVLILKIIFVIKIKLIEIYINIKSDPCNYITKKISLFFCVKYAFLILHISGVDECIFCYLTFDSLLKFITSLKITSISKLYIITQSDELKNNIVSRLSQKTGLTVDHIMKNIRFTPNEYELFASLMGINRLPEGSLALSVGLQRGTDQLIPKSRFIDAHKLWHTQKGPSLVTAIFINVGKEEDLDTIVANHRFNSVYLYTPFDHHEDRKKAVYRVIGFLYHPSCRKGLLVVEGANGCKLDYVPSRRSHEGKPLFLRDFNTRGYYDTGIISPKRTNLLGELRANDRMECLIYKDFQLKKREPFLNI
jgi:hypothetical protein